MEIEGIEKFLPDGQPVDECDTGRRDGLMIRYCRKKFKCILIFMLLGIAFCQTTAIILKTVDFDELSTSSNHINYIINKIMEVGAMGFSNNTTTQTNSTSMVRKKISPVKIES